MNDIINTAKVSHSRSDLSSNIHNSQASQNGQSSVTDGPSAGNEDTFQDSIKKVHDDSLPEQEVTEAEVSGNELPLSETVSTSSADNDRVFSIANITIGGFSEIQVASDKPRLQAATENMLATVPDIDGNVDVDPNDDMPQVWRPARMDSAIVEETSVMATNVKQLIKTDLNINAKNSPKAVVNVSAGLETVDKVDVQLQAYTQVNIEQMEMSAQKNPSLMTTIQQQMLASNQATLLPQSMAANVELDNDGMPLLYNASLNNISTTSLQSLPQAEIVETFAKPAWSQGMAKQILLMVNQNINSAEIRLNPAHLGPIEVMIDMSDDQVNVSLSSRHAIVREAMEQALPKLREMLEENGFSLADTDISQHSFAEQREKNAEKNSTNLVRNSIEIAEAAEINEQTLHQSGLTLKMVDYYI